MTTTTSTIEELVDNKSSSVTTESKTQTIEVSKEELEFEMIEDIQKASEYLRKVIDNADRFQFVTKSRLIRIYADKYKKAGFPLLEIIDEICKQLGNRVERHYVSKNLGPEYKSSARVEAGRENRDKRSNKIQVIDTVEKYEQKVTEPLEQGWKSDEGENDDGLSNTNYSELQQELKDKIISLEAIISEQDKQIKALKGEIQYTNMVYFEKWRKMDKAQHIKLDDVSKAATSELYCLIDIRDGHVIKAITDKEYNKMMKNKQD